METREANRKFLITFFVCFFLLLLSLIALHVYVDPRGIFGTNKYPVIVATARIEKQLLLEATDPKPKALILGSSHCMRFSPEVVENATGLKTFNLSVNSGKMEDFLALLNYAIKDIEIKPDMVILGVGPRTFCNIEDEGFDKRLISNMTLMNHVPLNSIVRLQKKAFLYLGTLNLNYLKDVRKSVKLSSRYKLSLTNYIFESDGFLAWEEPFNQEGALPTGPLERDTIITGFSKERREYFDIFLDICKKQGISLKIVITPYSPDYISRVDQLDGNYSRFNRMLVEFIESRNQDNIFELYDFSHIENYAGVNEFMGIAHPSIRNSTLMLNKMLTKGY